MIEELRIGNLGVIEESVLELGTGLTVVTGETGAGKTMVVTALALLLGGRADPGAVRGGAKVARIEGVIRTEGIVGLTERVGDVGGMVEEGRLVVARQIYAEGRSRAFVGGVSTPIGSLAEVVGPLVAIHGQSDQHRLLQPAAQRDALDRFAGEEAMTSRARFGELYHRLRATEAELVRVTATARERAREADLLRFGLGEIAAVAPQPGEDTAVAAEEQRLGHADTLRGAAEAARSALSNDDGGPDALAAVSAARKLLDGVGDHDPEAAALGERLAEVSYLLADLAADVASYASGLETDPARLATVSDRRAALLGLTRKYGATIDEVLAWAGGSEHRLLELESTDARIEELTDEGARLRDELARVGTMLTRVRTEAAERLATVVTDELADLAMPHARVSLSVVPTAEPGPAGADDAAILLAANGGADPRPLSKGASGGELSRVMLAIEVALAGTHPVPTLVFDEIDAGVGGRAAVEVGRRLAQLAQGAQVLVVTHLPQVAAYADRHIVVEKSSEGTVTTSGLAALDETGRVRELSRMLAGLQDSTTALAHAEELLATAQRHRGT